MFHLLHYVTENVKQSHAVRGGRFWIEFHPGQGNLTHTHGDRLRFRPRYFCPFFPVRGSGTPSRLQSPTTLHPYIRIKIKPTSTKRLNDRSTRRSNQVIKLTDYHISWHVASTFKRLTKWATHRDLSHFSTTSAGYHNYTTPPVVLTFQQELKSVQILFARERQETTRLLPYLLSMASIR